VDEPRWAAANKAFGRWAVPNVEVLKNYQIVLPSYVPLSSLGDVRNGYEEPRQAALLNGKPVVAFQVLCGTGSTPSQSKRSTKSSRATTKTLPADVKLQLIYAS